MIEPIAKNEAPHCVISNLILNTFFNGTEINNAASGIGVAVTNTHHVIKLANKPRVTP